MVGSIVERLLASKYERMAGQFLSTNSLNLASSILAEGVCRDMAVKVGSSTGFDAATESSAKGDEVGEMSKGEKGGSWHSSSHYGRSPYGSL